MGIYTDTFGPDSVLAPLSFRMGGGCTKNLFKKEFCAKMILICVIRVFVMPLGYSVTPLGYRSA